MYEQLVLIAIENSLYLIKIAETTPETSLKVI